MVQTALLGSFVSTHALAAYGACTVLIGFSTRLFNFLVDGVSAKTGKSVGRRAWGELGARVRRSLVFAALMGMLSLVILLPLQGVLMEDVLGLEGKVLRQADGYWVLRCIQVPLMLLMMSLSGILQGFRHVKVVAALSSFQAIVEMIGSAIVILLDIKLVKGSELLSVGIVSLLSYTISATVGMVLLFLLPPPEADESFSLWKELFSLSGRVHEGEDDLSTSLLLCESNENDHHQGATSNDNTQDESLLDFVKDGLNMLVRSLIMQTTFFIALMCSSRLGSHVLAAHSVINQLWILISYVVDGFAAAAIVLGSRLGAHAHDPDLAQEAKSNLQKLITRVLGAGLVTGIIASIVFYTQSDAIMHLFTEDARIIEILKDKTWILLVAVQPINSLVFVYDGLMYASQSFVFIRNYFLLGFFIIFMPVIGLQLTIWKSLWAVWLSKAVFNVWRCLGAAYLIHVMKALE